jgi:hypothetical protein
MLEQDGGPPPLPQQQQDDAVATGGQMIQNQENRNQQNRRAAAPARPRNLTLKTPQDGEIAWTDIEYYLRCINPAELDAGKGSNIARRVYDFVKKPAERRGVPTYKEIGQSAANRLRDNVQFYVRAL